MLHFNSQSLPRKQVNKQLKFSVLAAILSLSCLSFSLHFSFTPLCIFFFFCFSLSPGPLTPKLHICLQGHLLSWEQWRDRIGLACLLAAVSRSLFTWTAWSLVWMPAFWAPWGKESAYQRAQLSSSIFLGGLDLTVRMLLTHLRIQGWTRWLSKIPSNPVWLDG